MSTAETIQITDVGTVGVPVTDQDRALAFYLEKLGFETRMDGSFGPGLRWIEVAPPGATTTVALVASTADNPPGIDTGVRLNSANAVADHAALRARGVDVDPEVILYPVPMFTFRDQDANRLYVVERGR